MKSYKKSFLIRTSLVCLLSWIMISCSVNKQLLPPLEKVITQWGGDELHPKFSPDGTQLLVASNETGKYGIYLIAADGSHKTRLTGDSVVAIEPFWSPDGKRIGYRSNYEGKWSISVHTLESGEIKSVYSADSIMPVAADWSPEGKRIAFTGIQSGRACIYSLDIETSNLEQLTDGGDEYFPRWNSQGNQLAYYIGKNDSIMILDIVSKKTMCVNKGRFSGWRPTFSPSDDELAFISETGGHWDLWTTPLTNPLPVQITNTGFDDYPSWAPDGKSIAISRLMTVNQLYELKLDKLNVQQLTTAEFDQIDYRISSDFKRVIFGRISFGDELWIEDLQTKSNRQLTQDFGGRVKSPYWSPTEDSVVFVNQTFFPGGSNTDLYLVDSKSGLTSRITETGSATSPVWAKDGNIYFSQKDDQGFYQIHSFIPGENLNQQLTSGSVNRIINDFHTEKGVILYENNNGLFLSNKSLGDSEKIAKGKSGSFSPDGTQVAFVSNNNDERWDDIYVVNLQTKESKRLTTDRYSENTLAWRGDTKSIYFNANLGDKDIWVVKLDR